MTITAVNSDNFSKISDSLRVILVCVARYVSNNVSRLPSGLAYNVH